MLRHANDADAGNRADRIRPHPSMTPRPNAAQPEPRPIEPGPSRAARPSGRSSRPVRVKESPSEYALLEIAASDHRFLATLFEGLGCGSALAWVDRGTGAAGFRRVECEGLVTLLAECDGRTVAVAWSDFRVRAGSYSRASARRFTAFLQHLRERAEPVPLIYVVESAGLSLMEGRAAFSDVFATWPELLRYAEERPVLTCATGRCLGLAPILYGLGHYRVAVAGETQRNLTGPEVIRLFFGEGLDFDARAAAERCLEHHDLVHELVPSVAHALATFRGLLAPSTTAAQWPTIDPRSGALLAAIFDAAPREVVPGLCPRLRLFLGTHGGRALGVFLNPLGRSNNLATVRTLEKYSAGLDLFRALRLPIVSVLDSPGIDPRFDEGDAGLIRRILATGERIIRYPHAKLGIVAGRCFGGATTLGFPKVFAGSRVVALKGAQLGVMHERIVDQVLGGSPRLLAQWRSVAANQRADLSDMVAEGTVDAVVELDDVRGEVDRFLEYAAERLPETRRVLRSRTGGAADVARGEAFI